jgi:hypothetical protein
MRSLPILALLLACAGPLRADDFPGLHEPLRTVTLQYLTIQQKLASDSFDAVTATADAMKTAIAAAPPGSFAPDFVRAVNRLAAATDLHTARIAFQPLSEALIAALALNKVQTGSLHSLFCPMRRAYWVQTDGATVHNPYYGPSLPDSGEFQHDF